MLERFQDSLPTNQVVFFKDTNGVTRIKCGTIEGLLEVLVHPKGPDKDFELNFTMTFQSMISAKDLVEKLTDRFKNGEPKVKEK